LDRQRFRDYVLTQAEPWHREHLGRLYDLWDSWNEQFFDGRMVAPYILLSEPCIPRVYGDCSPVSGFGGLSQIRIRPSLLAGSHPDVRQGHQYAEGRFQLVADVVLHEAVHQFHQEVTGKREGGDHGHGPAFRDKCNQIGAHLGLPPVGSRKAKGPRCQHWPHAVRPLSYYQGAYARHERQANGRREQPASLLGGINLLASIALTALERGKLDAVRKALEGIALGSETQHGED
jgi:hypothetical protein